MQALIGMFLALGGLSAGFAGCSTRDACDVEVTKDADTDGTNTDVSDTAAVEREVIGDVDPREVPDGFEHVAEGGFANFCWRFPLGSDPEGFDFLHAQGHMAAANGHVYFLARTGANGGHRFYLHAVDSAGQLSWRIRVDYVNRSYPLIVDSSGNIIIISDTVDESNGLYSGSYITKVSSAGDELWVYGLPQGEPQAGDKPGLRGLAGAVDDNGNVYYGVSSFLVSVDPHGQRRWWVDPDPQEGSEICNWERGGHWSPVVYRGFVWFANEYCGLRLYTLEGVSQHVWSRTSDFRLYPYRNGVLMRTFDSDSLLLAKIDGGVGLVTSALDRVSPILIDSHLAIYGTRHLALLKLRPPDAIWSVQPEGSFTHESGWVDGQGRMGFISGNGDRLTTIDVGSGRRTFLKSFGMTPLEREMVMLTPGQAIVRTIDWIEISGSTAHHIDCFEVPLDLPPPGSWVLPHGDFRNRRNLPSGAVEPRKATQAGEASRPTQTP